VEAIEELTAMKLFDYDKSSKKFSQMISDFITQVEPVYRSENDTRFVDVSVEEERVNGRLLSDETLIPDRVIDSTIRRELPAFLSYLSGPRLVKLDNVHFPDDDPAVLETAFNTGCKYNGWLTEHYKIIDAGLSHGIAFAEVVYDETKPLKLALEFVSPLDFIYNRRAIKMDDNSCVIRIYRYTADQLQEKVVEFGFSQEVVDALVKSREEQQDFLTFLFIVYKVTYKNSDDGNQIYSLWYSKDGDAKKWLREPQRVELGFKIPNPQFGQAQQAAQQLPLPGVPPVPQQEQWQPVGLIELPYFAYQYYQTSQQELGLSRGIVFLQEFEQELQTTGMSALANNFVRGSGVYAYLDDPESQGSALKETSVKIRTGLVYNKKIGFFNLPPSDPNFMRFLQLRRTNQMQDAGQATAALQSKTGRTRPTAAEVDASVEDTQSLNGISISMYSNFIHQAYTFIFKIAKNLAQQNIIYLVGKKVMTTLPGKTEPELLIDNDQMVLAQHYRVLAAGDSDVIKRQDRLTKMANAWPMIQGTTIVSSYLQKFLELLLPEDGKDFALLLQQGDMMKNTLLALSQVVQAMLPDIAKIMPDKVQQVQQMIQAAQQLAGVQPQPNQQNGQQQSNSGASPASNQSTNVPTSGSPQPSA